MSQEQENAKLTDGDEGAALSALRGIWKAQGQSSADLDEACGNTKPCKSMEAVGFGGLADDVEAPRPDQTGGGQQPALRVEDQARAGGQAQFRGGQRA